MPVAAVHAPGWVQEAASALALIGSDATAPSIELPNLPALVPSVLPIFEDANGEKYTEIWHRGAKTVLGFVGDVSSEIDSLTGPSGGFVSTDAVQSNVPQKPSEDEQVLMLVTMAAGRIIENPPPRILDALRKMQSESESVSQRKSTAGHKTENQFSQNPNSTSTSTSSSPAAASKPDAYEWPMSPLQQYLFSQGLASMIGAGLSGATAKDIWNNGLRNSIANVPGLAMFFASQWVGKQVQELFNSWEVDDESSTAEHAAKQFAQLLASQIQAEIMQMISSDVLPIITGGMIPRGDSPGLLKKVTTMLTGLSSSASLAAAHDGMFDDKANTIKAAAHSNVLVNNSVAAAALSADLLIPASKVILDGSLTVYLGQDMFARATSVTAVPSGVMSPGPANVLIGGASPPAAATNAAAEALNATGSVAAAAKKSRDVTAAGEAARRDAQQAGKTPEQAQVAADSAAEQAAGVSQDVSGATHAMLNELTYRDGTRGTGSKKPLISVNQAHSLGGERWTVVEINDANSPGSTLPAGYRSVLWQNEAGQTVFVTQGTNILQGADWFNNFAQGFGFIPPQYQQAADDAQRYQSQYPGMIISGHSLGGGLATYAGLMTGLPVQAFNPAGLGVGSMANVAHNGFQPRPGQISVSLVQHDILTGLSTWIGQTAPFGNVQLFEGNGIFNSVSNHNVTNFGNVAGGVGIPIGGPWNVLPPMPPAFIP